MFPEKPMKLITREQWRKFNGTTNCHICLERFELGIPRLEITAVILGNIDRYLPIVSVI